MRRSLRIPLSPAQNGALERLAKQERRSLAQQVALYIERGLRQDGALDERPETPTRTDAGAVLA